MVRHLPYVLLAMAGGVSLALQAPINARLKDVIRSTALSSALVSTVVSVAVLAVLIVVSKRGDLGLSNLGAGPWWIYVGGLCGVVFLVASLVGVAEQGVTVTFVAVVAGQVVAAMVVDRFGWFGVQQIGLSWERGLAAVLLLVALALLLWDKGPAT